MAFNSSLRTPRQVRTLRQVLAQQPIGVTLPRTVRIGQEDLDRKSLSQALMLDHLFLYGLL